jgi:MFS family permease
MLRLTRYQWTVLFAAWLGWGFDIFDGLLFNYVAPNAIPTLLDLTIGSPEARSATLYWTGLITAIFLVGWAIGGVLFGPISDRYGRKRVLLITMVLYAIGTGLSAFVTSIEQLILCRFIASLGIGGEWAAGCALVAEAVPEDQRVEAGAVLYTSAPFGLFLATAVNAVVAGHFFADVPEVSWRYVLIFGLLPAAFAFWIRTLVKEPERWQAVAATAPAPRLRELFTPEIWPRTRSALLVALIALLTWWSCNAFIPVVASNLAQTEALRLGLEKTATSILAESWKTQATTIFNIGGLLGTLLTIPLAKHWGRKPMFAIYLGFSAVSLLATFGLDLPPQIRLYMYFFIGLTVFGIFGSFTFYLPELFPTRLRATGSGFTYNIGRIVAAVGPFFVGSVAAAGAGDPSVVLNTLFMVGFIPLIGLLGMGWIIETRGQKILD